MAGSALGHAGRGESAWPGPCRRQESTRTNVRRATRGAVEDPLPYVNWCGHGQEIIPLPLPDGRVTFVPGGAVAWWAELV
jgi:hypothetical protein